MREIDVSECDYYYKNDVCKNTCHWFGTSCELVNVKECMYKQLQQLKRENKELKDLVNAIKPSARYCDSHCSHFVLGECGQNHHDNCVGTDKCIKDLEQKLEKIKDIALNGVEDYMVDELAVILQIIEGD